MDLSTSIAGIPLEHPIMNAAGTCRLVEEVIDLSNSAVSAIMVGSITKEPREGNSGNVYHYDDVRMYSINSLGMPNRGAQYYRENLAAMVKIAHDKGKPLFVSVAGFTPEEYAELAELAFAAGVDLVELNMGCPNVWQSGKQKRIACFEKSLVGEILLRVEKSVGLEAKVAVKVSPFSDPVALDSVAEVIGSAKLVKVVSGINTFPNACAYDGKNPRITPADGFEGFGGPAMKPIGLGQIRQLRKALPESVQLIGVGGVTVGQDVLEYLQSGAVAVQVATAFMQREKVVFSALLDELIDLSEDNS